MREMSEQSVGTILSSLTENPSPELISTLAKAGISTQQFVEWLGETWDGAQTPLRFEEWQIKSLIDLCRIETWPKNLATAQITTALLGQWLDILKLIQEQSKVSNKTILQPSLPSGVSSATATISQIGTTEFVEPSGRTVTLPLFSVAADISLEDGTTMKLSGPLSLTNLNP